MSSLDHYPWAGVFFFFVLCVISAQLWWFYASYSTYDDVAIFMKYGHDTMFLLEGDKNARNLKFILRLF